MEEDKKKTIITTLVSGGVFIICIIILLLGKSPSEVEEENGNKQTDVKEFIPVMYKICDEDTCNYLLTSTNKTDSRMTYSKKLLEAYAEMDEFATMAITEDFLEDDDMYYIGGTKLNDVISNELKEKLSVFLEKLDYPYEMIGTLPVGSALLDVFDLMYEDAQVTQRSPLEYFYKKATYDDKTIHTFEKNNFQTEVIKNYSIDYCLKELEEIVDNYDSKVESIENTYEAYLLSDESKIINALEKDAIFEFEKGYDNSLYYNRNSSIANKIGEFLSKNKKVFIVLDAARVVGSNGVIDILSNSNYTISLVK